MLSLILICLLNPISHAKGEVQWYSKLKEDEKYYWVAKTAELRDLDTEEQYYHNRLVGAINLKGGDICLRIHTIPTQSFDFIGNYTLEFGVIVEGDMVVQSELEYLGESDYYLLILPIKVITRSSLKICFLT